MTRAVIIARIMLGGIGALSLGSAALAQQALIGTVTQVDRINGSIAIRQTQAGTVGATAAPAEEYKAPGVPLDKFHAGDGVTFSVTETGGAKTITKIDRQ